MSRRNSYGGYAGYGQPQYQQPVYGPMPQPQYQQPQVQPPFYPYSPGYSQNNYQSYRGNRQGQGVKKSGAKEVRGVTKDGVQYFGVSAWFVRKDVGLVKITAFENSKSTHYTTQQGKEGVSMMFEVLYKNSGVKRLEVAPYSFATGKVFLKELGIVISTRANNGGYAGFFSNKRNNR